MMTRNRFFFEKPGFLSWAFEKTQLDNNHRSEYNQAEPIAGKVRTNDRKTASELACLGQEVGHR